MEARADLQQCSDAAGNSYSPFVGVEYSRDATKKRRFARPVAADEPEGLAATYIEANVS
jgi:hypothetical protein